jgi:hypothetical protein
LSLERSKSSDFFAVHEWEQVGVSLFRAVGRAAEELVVSRERLSKPFTPGFLRKINNDIGKMEE